MRQGTVMRNISSGQRQPIHGSVRHTLSLSPSPSLSLSPSLRLTLRLSLRPSFRPSFRPSLPGGVSELDF